MWVYIYDNNTEKELKNWYIWEYVVGRPDISSATSDNKSVTIAHSGIEFQSICFSQDWTKLYASDYGDASYNSYITNYNLSTAWDISTATYNNKKYYATYTSWLYISPDGNYMFLGANGAEEVQKYTLATPYNITTGTKTEWFSISWVNLTWLCFSDDGMYMYYADYDSSKVYEYVLPSARTLTWATLVWSIAYPVTWWVYRSCVISPDWKKLLLSNQSGFIYQMEMSIANDITTAIYNNINYDTWLSICGLYVNPEWSKMYVWWISNWTVYQYSL